MNSPQNTDTNGLAGIAAAPTLAEARQLAFNKRAGAGNPDVEARLLQQAAAYGFDKEQALANQAMILRKEQAAKQQQLVQMLQQVLANASRARAQAPVRQQMMDGPAALQSAGPRPQPAAAPSPLSPVQPMRGY